MKTLQNQLGPCKHVVQNWCEQCRSRHRPTSAQTRVRRRAKKVSIQIWIQGGTAGAGAGPVDEEVSKRIAGAGRGHKDEGKM